MKAFKIILSLFCICVILQSCNAEECEPGYVADIDGFCVPKFNDDMNQNFDPGSKFYHDTHSFIYFENGQWFDESHTVILDLK
ncbi:MAG: hypothetical protein BM564_03440 [Bacteroidetes bacterium MedPE-SWsnd-G2]|nr:MAG: hypothetical protein BM564_03440 [Bacteroidetes bacterium MedPE-SWsnd-G2]